MCLSLFHSPSPALSFCFSVSSLLSSYHSDCFLSLSNGFLLFFYVTYRHTHVHTCTHICTCACKCVCIWVCVCVCVCAFGKIMKK